MRGNQTSSEGLLWHALSGRKVHGLKFRRQHLIGPYVADFLCFEKSLVVEVDGSQHDNSDVAAQDATRTEWLKSQGFSVVRVPSSEVLANLEGVVLVILEAAGIEDESPAPATFPRVRNKK